MSLIQWKPAFGAANTSTIDLWDALLVVLAAIASAASAPSSPTPAY